MSAIGYLIYIGVWLSLVERLVRDQEAAGSSPVTPTIDSPESMAVSGESVFLRIRFLVKIPLYLPLLILDFIDIMLYNRTQKKGLDIFIPKPFWYSYSLLYALYRLYSDKYDYYEVKTSLTENCIVLILRCCNNVGARIARPCKPMMLRWIPRTRNARPYNPCVVQNINFRIFLKRLTLPSLIFIPRNNGFSSRSPLSAYYIRTTPFGIS